jgi:hypothetical protein
MNLLKIILILLLITIGYKMREIKQEKKLIIINENLKLQNIELELRIKKLKNELKLKDGINY